MSIIKFIAKVVAGVLITIFTLGAIIAMSVPSSEQVSQTQTDIETKVAEDQINQYDIVLKSGTAMERCVQAGFVAAAWLQANNQQQYQAWQKIKSADCKTAGLPQ